MLNILGLSNFSEDESNAEEVKEEDQEEAMKQVKEEEAESDGNDPIVIYKKWRKLQEGTKLDR